MPRLATRAAGDRKAVSRLGERPIDLETFHPDRMSSRILGMGDVVTLVEKAAEQFKEEEAAALEEKIRKSTFSFDDFLDQLNKLRRMGGIMSLLKFIPGMNQIPQEALDENTWHRRHDPQHDACRTPRRNPRCLRKQRIAKGSGITNEVNQIVKQFMQMYPMAQMATQAQSSNDVR